MYCDATKETIADNTAKKDMVTLIKAGAYCSNNRPLNNPAINQCAKKAV